MTADRTSGRTGRGRWTALQLLGLLLLLSQAQGARAENCSEYPNGVIDGATGTPVPSQIQVDRNCTIRNYPASNPLSTNFSFLTQPGQTDQRWVVVFDNVVHTGQMACNAVAGHKIWFTNGSSTSIQEGCQNYLIPVEKIDKQNPPGTTTATVGVPFTYTLTSPVLFDPGTGTVINTAGSLNDLHGVVLTDDLNAVGADLSYVGHEVYWRSSGDPVPYNFSNVGGVLTFSDFPIIPAGEQVIIEMTVVLDDTPANTPGTQFVNTAKWEFGRLIDGEFFQPLPGEWGISPPLTIAAPTLEMTKSGPATLDFLETGAFTLDVRNAGTSGAYEATILDRLPDGADGGMCDLAPVITGAQVFGADGTSPVPGKGPLTEGADYTAGWSGAPNCELTLALTSAAAAIGPGERLIVTYETRLDDDTRNGVALTNVAGAVEWFGGDASNPDRQTFTRSLTNGTVGTVDHEDAHTVTTALTGYFFEKTVANLTSGANPASTAAPGDRLRYTLRLRTTDSAFNNVRIRDDLGALNATAVFEPGSLSLVSVPAGASAANTNPNGGTNGAGLLDVSGLNVAADSEIQLQFDITLAEPLLDGQAVLNQADLIENGTQIADSDDPNVNGPADPAVDGDEDPTRIVIQAEPPPPLAKANTQDTAAVGEAFSYRVTVPTTPHTAPLYDVRILDDLGASAAELAFVSVTKIAGSGSWTPVNTGTDTSLVIEDPANGIDIPAGEQVTVEITVRLQDTATNVPGLTFTNTAAWTYNQLDRNDTTQLDGLPATSPPMTIVGPELVFEKSGPATLNLGESGSFTLDVRNTGTGDAWETTILDRLPDSAAGGMCDVTPQVTSARVYAADGTSTVPGKGPLTQGVDFSFVYSGAPNCELTLAMRTAAAAIGPGERLIINYETELDGDTQDGTALTNVAGAVEWFNADNSNFSRQRQTRGLTDGTVGTVDHEDAHTVTSALTGYFFEKSVANLTSGANPSATAAAGDTLRYTLRLRTFDTPFNNVSIVDDLGELNAGAVFVPGSLNLVSVPAGADGSNTNPGGGTNGAGLIDVRNVNVAAGGDQSIVFDVTLASPLLDGTVVLNQADLIDGGAKIADSDDPNVNGSADPDIAGDEDPTRVVIEAEPPPPLAKANTQATAAVGEAFSYRVTVPATPHTAPLYDVRILDDLGASAADLEFVSVTKIAGSGSWTPVNTGTSANLVIEDPASGIDIPAGEQVTVEITVRLQATATNVPGLAFTNTAAWSYNQLDQDDTSERPGEPGTTQPMTIVGPDLVLAKSGPATLNLGLDGAFTLDVRNAGTSGAYEATILDRLPDGADGGMCDLAPVITGAQVFGADGTSPVPGKGPLTEGADYTAGWSGAPNCELTLALTSAAAAIGPGERLIVTYETRLDDDTRNGVALTNVAGAVEWFGGDASNPDRQTFTRSLTNGTVGTVDHEDAHTVTTALTGYFFEKTVANLTSGANPASTAAPGDRLRYTLRLRTTDSAFNNVRIRDDLGALNATAVFEPGSLSLVSVPAGASAANTNPNGGTNGAGLLDVSGLNVAADSEIQLQFDITLAEPLLDGQAVLNQADLIENGTQIADSDDPNVNGPADPAVDGDEDPTRIVIQAEPPPPLAKANTQDTAAVGEAFSYRVTVPTTPHTAPLYDVRILDDLGASAAELAFVSVTKIAGSGSWTPVNTGTDTSLVIEDPANGIDIPAGEQVTVEITVRLQDTATNVPGLTFTNTAAWTYNQLDRNDTTQLDGLPATSPPMTIVGPELVFEKSGPAQMRIGVPGTYTLDVHNVGGATAWAVQIEDLLPNTNQGGQCETPPEQISAQLYEADGTTAVGAALAAGTDFETVFAGAPDCRLTLTALTPEAAIGPDQHLIVSYQAFLDADSQQEAAFTNVAGATGWYSADPADPDATARQETQTLTNGTVGTLDHEDAHTTVVFSGQLRFEKTVANVTSGADPAATAEPGDVLRYRLELQNVGDVPVNDFPVVVELDRLNAVPAFQPGSLNLVTVPAGASVTATNPAGGANGSGLLDVGGLSLDLGETLVIEFEAQLGPVLANGSDVANQSQLVKDGVPLADSDDPNVNGQADPLVAGDEDPTRVRIISAPVFDVDKTSTYLDGDPAVLLAGERLRYTITVRNVGSDHAADARLIDALPVNTTYVADSTTLNGVVIADAADGRMPLTDGIDLYAPADPTPGVLRVDLAGAADNVATIEFVVTVNPEVVDGTVIANQAFVSAVATGVVDQPSDDPRTDVVDDPTRDVVGNLPLLFAEKSAELQADGGTPGIVDPGDVLRYTIEVHNNGSVPATAAQLTDTAPNDTTYVADTLMLNGEPVGRPDGGVFPLAAGLPISSADLTPPLPAAGEGVLSPGESATVQFDVQVNAGTPAGTLITNQASVATAEAGGLLTDGDGNPATGPEPTVVVVGDVQQLAITKEVSVVGGGAALAGSELEYTVLVTNIGNVPAYSVVITDDLEATTPGTLAYVAGSAVLNGAATGVSVAGPALTADYSTTYGPMEPGDFALLRFRAVLNPDLPIGTTVINTGVVTWDDPARTESATAYIDVGGAPGVGTMSGSIWRDVDFDLAAGETEPLAAGWQVDLFRNDQPIGSTLTDENGDYVLAGLAANDETDDRYTLRFRSPDAGLDSASLGTADSFFTNGPQEIDDIIVTPGSVVENLNLPLTPNGVVYDSIRRASLAGATLRMSSGSGAPLPEACFDDPAQQGQVTRADGYYKFDLNFSDPACPSGASYLVEVTPPGADYTVGASEIIPPASAAGTAPFSVPTCPGSAVDVIPATAEHCEAQPSPFAPDGSVRAQDGGTLYYLNLTLDGSQKPGSSQLFNNHIPVDPVLDGVVGITKTTPSVNVTRGQLVPYTITVNNTYVVDLPDITVVDRYPAGFRYVEGSATVDGEPMEPTVDGLELTWSGLVIPASGQRTIKLLLAVSAGVTEGEFVNRAQAINGPSGAALSGEATATVRLVPDPTFDCTDVTGKVFDDGNRNGTQDPGESGLAGVRVMTVQGLSATTDAHGRFHVTCAVTPRETRGSNFMLKLDDRTLPSGFRMSTKQAQVKRATRGKALSFSFGASIHRVVGLDIADPVFEPGTTEMRPQWQPRIALLLEELQKAPATLRLSYVADIENPRLVEQRLSSVRKMVTEAWEAQNCCYELSVESEVFWRRGGPPDRAELRIREGR